MILERLEGIRVAALLAIVVFLLITAMTDIRIRRIPNRFLAAGLFLAVPVVFLFPEISWADRLGGAFGTGGLMLLLALPGKGAFGGGDVKLMWILGFLLGLRRSLWAFAAAVLLAGVYVIGRLLAEKGNLQSEIAFAPFLCLGAALQLITFTDC